MIEVELKAWVDDPSGLEAALAARFRFAGSYRKEDVYYRLEPPARSAGGSRFAADPSPAVGAPLSETGLSQPVEFRLRIENGAAYVTCKEKHVDAGIEVNLETEFGVTEPAAFDAFARFIGARPFVRKVKVGRLYEAHPSKPEAGSPSVAADERSGSGSDEEPLRPVAGANAQAEADRGAGAGRAVMAPQPGGSIHLELSEVERLGTFIEIEKLIETDDPAVVAAARGEIWWLLESLGIGAAKIEPRYYIDMIAAVERGEKIAPR